jgi:tetratricopeptide (TPR) repeat protein
MVTNTTSVDQAPRAFRTQDLPASRGVSLVPMSVPLFAIMLVGLLLRLWLWWRIPIHQPANDEVEYLQVARDLLAGHGWVFYEQYHWLRAPLYPLFLAGSLLLAGGDLRWAALPNIVVSTATIYLFYILGRMVTTDREKQDSGQAPRAERVGLLAAAITALWLPLATFASLWMSETLFTALFTGAAIALLHWSRRPTLIRAASVGVLLGLAILTRSVPLAALPLLGIWMLWHRRRCSWGNILGCIVLCFALLGSTVAPWTLRNWLAYDAFIPVETGLSYNLWAFYEPREDLETIQKTLESIANPAERSALATEKGLARLREDPTILLRRITFNWFYLWNIAPTEDRFRQASYFEDVSLNMFILALVLDDGLYLLMLGGALGGLLVARNNRQKVLLLGWLVYVVMTTLLTHSEGRYRHLLLPALIPFAATFWPMHWWQGSLPRWRIAAATVVLLGLLPLRHYPYQWASTSIAREAAKLAGDRALARGDAAGARAAYRRATEIDPDSADALLRLGMAFEESGKLQRAAEAYDWARLSAPMYVAAHVRLGDILRRMGATRAARESFAGAYLDPQQVAEWGWRNLDGSPPRLLDIGDGLDIGYVEGMYPAEMVGPEGVRWTTGNATVRLSGGAQHIRLIARVAAPRPTGQPVPVDVCVAETCQSLRVGSQWRTYRVYLVRVCDDSASCHQPLEVTLRSSTFVPAGLERPSPGVQPNQDTRRLGIMVDFVAAEPVPPESQPGS